MKAEKEGKDKIRRNVAEITGSVNTKGCVYKIHKSYKRKTQGNVGNIWFRYHKRKSLSSVYFSGTAENVFKNTSTLGLIVILGDNNVVTFLHFFKLMNMYKLRPILIFKTTNFS